MKRKMKRNQLVLHSIVIACALILFLTLYSSLYTARKNGADHSSLLGGKGQKASPLTLLVQTDKTGSTTIRMTMNDLSHRLVDKSSGRRDKWLCEKPETKAEISVDRCKYSDVMLEGAYGDCRSM